MNKLNPVLTSTLDFSEAILTCLPSILCILFCLLILFQSKLRYFRYKATYFFIILQILIIINCFCESKIILGASKNNAPPKILLHIYLLTFYSLAVIFYLFCKYLDGKSHWKALTINLFLICSMVYCHKNGGLVNDFRSNGFIYVHNPSSYFWVFELSCCLLTILSIWALVKNSMNDIQAVRTHSIVILFASAPIIIFLLITLLLMRNTNNYTTVVYAPAFFIWVNIAFLFTSHRAVVDMSLSKQHIRAYSLLVRSTESSTSNKERIKLIEKAWNMLATHTESNPKDIPLNKYENTVKDA